MGRIKRDSDPKNDFGDGYNSALRRTAKRLGLTWTEFLNWLRRK